MRLVYECVSKPYGVIQGKLYPAQAMITIGYAVMPIVTMQLRSCQRVRTGYMNNSESNTNLQDTRNWQGSGNRSVANMFIDLGIRLKLSDEQFLAEMENRRKVLNLGPNDHVIGCPLCLTPLIGGGFAEAE
jgi:hypothetical protein